MAAIVEAATIHALDENITGAAYNGILRLTGMDLRK